jgi:hypothetical protein
MLKISWGVRITILYIGFVLLIGVMVFMCMNQKIDLVSKDYYEKELVFQRKINEMNNAALMDEKITHRFSDKDLEIQFPECFKGKVVKGNIVLFRPSDEKLDYHEVLTLDQDNIQRIDLNVLKKGMYKIQIDWQVNETSYFNEETIVIP